MTSQEARDIFFQRLRGVMTLADYLTDRLLLKGEGFGKLATDRQRNIEDFLKGLSADQKTGAAELIHELVETTLFHLLVTLDGDSGPPLIPGQQASFVLGIEIADKSIAQIAPGPIELHDEFFRRIAPNSA
ncbi:MAG TPA: hypothetical protein PLF88_15230 [Opitutaceae bacterium]|nr:hypothetical protein [Opitutaceae bacterium]